MKRWHLAVLITALSCGSRADEGGAREDEPIDMSPQSVCAYYAERDCAGWQKCNSPEVRYFFGDLAGCKERMAKSCVSRLTATGTNETPSAIVACAKAVATLSCENYLDFERWPEACTVPPGNLPDGAGCILSGQCQGGHCAIAKDKPCGACKTVSRVGETCAAASDCLDLMPCVNGMCSPHPKLGEACDTKERFCITGLICRNLDASGLGTCEKLLAAGSRCDARSSAPDECDYTQALACDVGTQSCKATPDPFGAAGAKCSSSSDCNGLTFCSGQICQPRPRDGELCVPGMVDCVHPAKCIDNVCTLRDAASCQ